MTCASASSVAATERPGATAAPPATTAITVAGAALELDPAGAAWWPARRTLIVADLHFEKGSAFAARGVRLPPYDSRATLSALAAVIARHAPRRLIALGDSFHDRSLDARMAPMDRDRLAAMVAAMDDWVWIAGNHDPRPPGHLGGRATETLTLDGLTFRHEPAAAPTPAGAGEVAGHLHPCARIRRRGRSVRRRCFVTDGARLIMPAFGAFTGGLNVCAPPITSLFANPPMAYMLGADRTWPVAAQHWRPD